MGVSPDSPSRPLSSRIEAMRTALLAISSLALACSSSPQPSPSPTPGSRGPTTEMSAPGAAGLCVPSGINWVDPTGTVVLPMETLRPVDQYVFPHYPDRLRSAGIEGTVVASFLVDTTGHVDARSVRVKSSTDPLFSRAVCEALPRMRMRRVDRTPLLSPARTSADFTFNIAR